MTAKKSSMFDHLNAIYADQSIDYYDRLSVENRKSYNIWMLNRLISMNPDQVAWVNMFQSHWQALGPRESYLFYSQLFPRRRQFNKYIKPKKEAKILDWVVTLVAQYHKINAAEATDGIEIMLATPEGKDALREILEAFGTDPKQVKKAVK